MSCDCYPSVLFLMVPWIGLQCVIVVFPDNTHLLFWEQVCNKIISFRFSDYLKPEDNWRIKCATLARISECNNFSDSKSRCDLMPPIKIWFNLTYGSRGDVKVTAMTQNRMILASAQSDQCLCYFLLESIMSRCTMSVISIS